MKGPHGTMPWQSRTIVLANHGNSTGTMRRPESRKNPIPKKNGSNRGEKRHQKKCHTVSGSSKVFAVMLTKDFKHSSSRSAGHKRNHMQKRKHTFNDLTNSIVVLQCCQPEIWDAFSICKQQNGRRLWHQGHLPT